MKILHVIPSIAAVHGGPSVMIEMMAAGLARAGFEVHIATTNDDGAGKLPVPCGEPVLRDGLTYFFFNRQTGFYKFSMPLSQWLSKHVSDYRIIHIHALFSHSSWAAARWAHRRNVPYIVRPLGVLTSAHPELADRPIILFLSRFDRKKGLELLLPAFARVRRQIPDAALVLAGSGDNELVDALKTQARELGIADEILWTGFLQNEAKLAAFDAAAVFVLPSWSENFGVAVIEAMAAGCPVVVTDQVAVHTDIAAAHAGYAVPCEAEALATALCRLLLDDPSSRAIMGSNGKCLTQTHYSPAAVTAKLTAAYRAILA